MYSLHTLTCGPFHTQQGNTMQVLLALLWVLQDQEEEGGVRHIVFMVFGIKVVVKRCGVKLGFMIIYRFDIRDH
jgi:hypothetical protein